MSRNEIYCIIAWLAEGCEPDLHRAHYHASLRVNDDESVTVMTGCYCNEARKLLELIESDEAKYDALVRVFAKQERIMKKVAASLRDIGATSEGYSWSLILEAYADKLDPPEGTAEADAAEKFSRQCAERRITASSPPSEPEPPSA